MSDSTPIFPSADRWADWRSDFSAALGFLTRAPRLPRLATAGADEAVVDLARAMRAFPVVGALLGLASALVYVLAYAVGLPPLAAALLALASGAFATGALHEDGLADLADGLAGGNTAQERLAIMADSRIGAAGTLALVFGIVLKAAALSALATPGVVAAALVAAGAGSRAIFPAILRRLEPARPDGLSAAIGVPGPDVNATAIAIGGTVVAVCLGLAPGFAAALGCALLVFAIAGIARKKIGGHTGDVLGAAQQMAEIVILLVAAAAFGAA